MLSRPAIRFSQNAARSSACGKRPLMPTMAMGSRPAARSASGPADAAGADAASPGSQRPRRRAAGFVAVADNGEISTRAGAAGDAAAPAGADAVALATSAAVPAGAAAAVSGVATQRCAQRPSSIRARCWARLRRLGCSKNTVGIRLRPNSLLRRLAKAVRLIESKPYSLNSASASRSLRETLSRAATSSYRRPRVQSVMEAVRVASDETGADAAAEVAAADAATALFTAARLAASGA